MPYSTPTSPIPSPEKPVSPPVATHHRHTWLEHHYDVNPYGDGPSKDLRVLPRRSSSSKSISKSVSPSPSASRTSSSSASSSSTARPPDGVPEQSTSSSHGALGVSGLPNSEAGSSQSRLAMDADADTSTDSNLTMQRGSKDSMDSTSTIDSCLPQTPNGDHEELPFQVDQSRVSEDETLHNKGTPKASSENKENSSSSIPFPSFEPPPIHRSLHIRPPRTSSESPSRHVGASRRSVSYNRTQSSHTNSHSVDLPPSASTSTLHDKSFDSTKLSRPSSMIRKKSGEVVKPSLKVRSMSTPDLTRSADTASDETEEDNERQFGEERSKSVRFAGDDEHDPGALENVITYFREQKPVQLGQEVATDTETEMDTDASDFVQFRTKRNALARAIDEAERIVLEGGSRVPRIRVDFAPDARGLLAQENVVLERIDMGPTPGPLCLKGTVIVRNLSFQKWVAVRFTMDHWQTVSEVSGSHVCHIPSATTGDEGWDRFAFTIKLDDVKRKLEERQMILCVRFSVDGKEWWDSNNGINYNFSFKKIAPRRPVRNSTPPNLGGNFASHLHGRHRNPSPIRDKAVEIGKAFGVSGPQHPQGPREWVFPRLVAGVADGPARTASPALSPPPAASFKAPEPPNAKLHLSLSKYCAPSPPTSPQDTSELTLGQDSGSPGVEKMDIHGGQFATLSPPQAEASHSRASSWNGPNKSGSWESFSHAIEKLETNGTSTPIDNSMSSSSSMSDLTDDMEHINHNSGSSRPTSDGDVTPVALGSRSPMQLPTDSESSGASSPVHRPLHYKRSTGDLQALLMDSAEDSQSLSTPPSSNLSSPPSPRLNLPLGSPSTSISTGESSPVQTASNGDSATDLTNLPVIVDPEERGRRGPANYKVLSDSYQEFLDKFCFFRSPGATPIDETPYPQPGRLPVSGTASPLGFPFGHHGQPSVGQSPRLTPTPAQQHKALAEEYEIAPIALSGTSSPAKTGDTPRQGTTTPRITPPATPSKNGSLVDAPIWQQDAFRISSPPIAST